LTPLEIVGIISLVVLVILKIYYIQDIIKTFKRLFRRSVTGRLEGENWTSLSVEGRVEPGEEVVVTGVNNLVLSVVRKK